MSLWSGDGEVVPVFGFWRKLWIHLTFWRYYREGEAWLREKDGVVFVMCDRYTRTRDVLETSVVELRSRRTK